MEDKNRYVRYRMWIDEDECSFDYLFVYSKKNDNKRRFSFFAEMIDGRVYDIVTGEEIKYSSDPYSGGLAYKKVLYTTPVDVAQSLRKFTEDTILCYKNFMEDRKAFFANLHVLHQIQLQNEYEEECNARLYIKEFVKKNRK